jgi:hypothetical protein
LEEKTIHQLVGMIPREVEITKEIEITKDFLSYTHPFNTEATHEASTE